MVNNTKKDRIRLSYVELQKIVSGQPAPEGLCGVDTALVVPWPIGRDDVSCSNNYDCKQSKVKGGEGVFTKRRAIRSTFTAIS